MRYMATAAKAGPIEKLEPWDMKSGFASMSEMAPAILFVFGGATVLFFGLPKLYGSKIPGTFDPEWKKAQLIREHAKERQAAPGEPIGRNPFTNKISPKDYLNPPQNYRVFDQ